MYTLSKSKRQRVVMYGDDRALVGIFFGLLEKEVFNVEKEAEKEEEEQEQGRGEEEKKEKKAMEVEQEGGGGGHGAQAEGKIDAATLSSNNINEEEVVRIESYGENPRRVAL